MDTVVKVRGCDDANKSKSKQKLPDDIIFNILSFLPLRSLYRFKCVCKLWNTLSLHPFFLYLYKVHTLGVDMDFDLLISFDNRESRGFTTICQSSHQLVVQRSTRKTPTTYRILSCELRDVLPIPAPQYHSLCITLEFVPSSKHTCAPDGAVKLVSVHEDGKKLSYEVLTLKIGHLNTACRWQPINIPSSSKHHMRRDGRKRNNIQLFFRMGFAYCIWFVDDDLDVQVDVLDMVNETYIGHTTLSRANFFSNLTMNMSTTLHLLDWNGLLSFAQLLNDDLHVLVLDHPTKLKWAETKRVIKLQFLTEDHNNKQRLITFHACAEKSFLLFLWHDDKLRNEKSLCKYDIYTGELCTSEPQMILSSTMTDAEFVALTVAKIPFFKARCMI